MSGGGGAVVLRVGVHVRVAVVDADVGSSLFCISSSTPAFAYASV
jgi:hypothetical protein